MAFLTLMNGEDRGRVDAIEDTALVGRSPKCDVQYTDLTVSRRHARITREEDEYYITDLQSQHGTVVDGKRIGERERLPHGAQVKMGACELVFDSGQIPDARPTESVGSDSSSGTAVLDAAAAIESHRQGHDTKLRAVLEIMHNVGIALDIETIFPKILDSMMSLFPGADRACIQLLNDGATVSETQQVAPNDLRLAAGWGRDGAEPEFPLSRTLIQQVLVQGKGIVSADVPGDNRLQTESVYRMDLRSLMAAPLLDDDRKPVGLIYIDSKHHRRTFEADDLHVLITIANLAAKGLGRARLHAQLVAFEKQQLDLQTARDLQLHFLPRKAPEVSGYGLATYYKAAQNVGGDYLGCLPLDDGRLALIVADVAGKGMTAALVMARLCSDIRFALEKRTEANEVMHYLNDQFLEQDEYGRFVTMALALLNPSTHDVQLANAGHPPPLLRHGSEIQTWDREHSGPPLGVLPGAEYGVDKWRMSAGDCLLLHSDGANEAECGEEQFGLSRVASCFGATQTAEEAVKQLKTEVTAFMGEEAQPDDICILAAMRES